MIVRASQKPIAEDRMTQSHRLSAVLLAAMLWCTVAHAQEATIVVSSKAGDRLAAKPADQPIRAIGGISVLRYLLLNCEGR
jgi:hypothetical protein